MTSTGLLRLTDSTGACPAGTTKTGLARGLSAPQAATVSSNSSNFSGEKSLALLSATTLDAQCVSGSTSADAQFSINPNSASAGIQTDGMTYLVLSGAGTASYVRGSETPIASGPSSFISNQHGYLDLQSGGNGYATLNADLIVKVAGALFTVKVIADVNGNYCRIYAMVEQAAAA